MRKGIYFTGLILLSLTQLAALANGQAPPVPERPVVVVNSASNPVPVTGAVEVTNAPTVNARQSGPWSVTVGGTPTFAIDPNNNTVKVVRAGTSLVSNRSINYISTGVTFNPVDISAYSKVRIQFTNSGNSDLAVTIYSQDLSALPQVYLFEYETFTVPALGRVNRLYDTLGTMVNMRLASSGTGSVQVGVFGS